MNTILTIIDGLGTIGGLVSLAVLATWAWDDLRARRLARQAPEARDERAAAQSARRATIHRLR